MQIGDIVISRAGHDKGEPFVVVAEVNSDFVMIANGAARSLENPKLKRKKHLRKAESSGLETFTNAALKARIKQFISVRRSYAEK